MWQLMILHTKSRMTPQCPLWVDAIVLCFVYFVRFGSLADISRLLSHVRFTPESGHRVKQADVRFVPEADMVGSFQLKPSM